MTENIKNFLTVIEMCGIDSMRNDGRWNNMPWGNWASSELFSITMDFTMDDIIHLHEIYKEQPWHVKVFIARYLNLEALDYLEHAYFIKKIDFLELECQILIDLILDEHLEVSYHAACNFIGGFNYSHYSKWPRSKTDILKKHFTQSVQKKMLEIINNQNIVFTFKFNDRSDNKKEVEQFVKWISEVGHD